VAQIYVLVATTSPDLKAEGIASSVVARPDMTLIENRVIDIGEVDTILDSVPIANRCALVLVGPAAQTNDMAQRCLARRDDLVVMLLDIVGDIVRIGLRDPRLESLVTALRELVERVGTQRRERVVSIQLRSGKAATEEGAQVPDETAQHPLLEASINWVHELLRHAVESVSDENGDVHGLSVTAATLLQSLDTSSQRDRETQERELLDAEETLNNALAAADESAEPLAVAWRVFGLSPLEFRLLVLALAPEFDLRFQRCIGFLLDEMGRRVGTIALYNSLLGITPAARGEANDGDAFSKWLVFETYGGRPAAADEPLRVDPFLVQWLLGETASLINDPRVRRTLRLTPWPGSSLLQRPHEKDKAGELIEKLQRPSDTQWLLVDGDDLPAWRALLELGAAGNAGQTHVNPIRVEANRLTGSDLVDVEDCARRIGRMARLNGDPLFIDISKTEGTPAEDDLLRVFLATINDTGCNAAVICREEARIVRLLGTAPYDLLNEAPLTLDARIDAVRTAAQGAGAYVTTQLAETMATRYPMHVDALEHSMHLARSRARNLNAADPDLDRFTAACKELASEGISRLVDRLEPIFTLDDVVLPADRKQQLSEIVDHVRLASRVLDGWKFRDQLPYGRGVAALFSGLSGTGKTMAAMGIARSLGIQVLRLDLSRVVSKYIGETEKHLDTVFTDAQRSGAAILIDEADALFGKRSEVKDAHDRYANIEVAYLLQRMEAYEGLAILTTNMRKNLDPAFTRRLRFIVDFPRPDAPAREKIWRLCLPDESHEIADVEFRQLARRLELTGGQIRQITLRAAFIAAAANEQIQLKHVATAVRAELTKLGLPPVEIDLSQTRRAA
jgi:SpoVK/Ycf46/Vps4 family AAA+-type ATPase